MTLQEAKTYRKEIEKAAISLPDDEAILTPEMFRHWEPNEPMTADERVYYEPKLYRVVQSHTSQEGWEPDKTPALFTEVAKPGEIPVWKQPTGVQDAYMTGDKVHYPTADDPVYVSTVDNNVWEPGVYGLELDE